MSEQGKMTDAEIVESYISDLHRKTDVSDCYTPTDGEVLEAWAAHNTPDLPTALDLVGAYDAFKRWLAEHDAKVRAEEREKTDRELSDAEVEAAAEVFWEYDMVDDYRRERARAALIAAQEVRRG